MKNKEVLIIEDDPKWQRELKLILVEAGYEVSLAGNYSEAIEALERNTANVAVVDISLIIGDAGDRQGRKIAEKARIPVVCVSGYLSRGEVGDLLAEDLAEWFFDKAELGKPNKIDKFLGAVEDSMVKSEAENRARWRIIERKLRPGD